MDEAERDRRIRAVLGTAPWTDLALADLAEASRRAADAMSAAAFAMTIPPDTHEQEDGA